MKKLLCVTCLVLIAGLLRADEISVGMTRKELESKYNDDRLDIHSDYESSGIVLGVSIFGKQANAVLWLENKSIKKITYNFHFEEKSAGGRLQYFSELVRAMEAEKIEDKGTFVRLDGVTLMRTSPEIAEHSAGLIAKIDPGIMQTEYTPGEKNLIIFQFKKSGVPYSLSLHGDDYGTLDATARIELKVGKDDPILITAPM